MRSSLDSHLERDPARRYATSEPERMSGVVTTPALQ
jgi:hypothetical protein